MKWDYQISENYFLPKVKLCTKDLNVLFVIKELISALLWM